MRFMFDQQREGSIWVDRGIDDKADRFEPCEICEATLRAKALEDRVWQELEMCSNCQADLAVQTLADESLGVPRPYIGERNRGPMDEEIIGKRPVEPLNFERCYPREGIIGRLEGQVGDLAPIAWPC